MRAVFVDASVLLCAVGGAHPRREGCRELLRAATQGTLLLHGSVEVVQEALFHRLRKTDRPSALAQVRSIEAMLTLHDFDHAVLTRMLDLVEHTRLRGRDAVHAATALEHGFTEIVTADRDFDGIPGLTRIEPEDAVRS